MGVRDDFAFGKFADLVAHRLHGLVETRVTDGRARRSAVDEGNQSGAVLHSVADGDQRRDGIGVARRDGGGLEAEIARADELALAHRNATENLREVFAEPDAGQQILGLAEQALGAQSLAIGDELADRFHIGREPGEAVDGVLLALQRCA